ncbi:ribonuclease H-like domain-containing protein [Tanacetum coccineum]
MEANIVHCIWLFCHKYLTYGILSRYKARLVPNGSMQLEGIDVDETFSLVVKSGTIRTNLSLATSRQWPVDQLDVKNEFLHGDLSKTIYMHQPPRFQDVCTSKLCFVIADYCFIASVVFYDLSRILGRAHMVNCNPRPTLVDTESKLGDDGDPVFDPTLQRSLAGALQILRYVRGTLDHGLQLFSSFTTFLVSYLDVDWTGFPTTRRLTSGYCVFIRNNLLSWSSKRQPMLSRSSDEVEYHGVANDVAEIWWLRNLLCELHIPLSCATHVYCDNVSAVYLSSNPVQHQHMKYIEIDIRFVRDLVAAG